MKLLEDRILQDGQVFPGDVLKVDSFVNHRIDVPFMNELAKEFYRLFKDEGVTEILTVEASGIGIACLTATYFGCPVVFAKKDQTANISGSVYTAQVYSYTHGKEYTIRVEKGFIGKEDKVLIIDDFLANGEALRGLITLVDEAGASLAGAGVIIEKAFQPGGEDLRKKGVRVEALARIASMDDDGKITFVE